MDSFPKLSAPSPPPEAPYYVPSIAQRTARLIGWIGWLGFWAQLIAGAAIACLVIIALVSRLVDRDGQALWVGVALFTAIVGTIALFASTFLSFRLTRSARRIMLPHLKPTPSPEVVTRQLSQGIFVSTLGLGISLLGTEFSTLSLLANTLAHPQGAALYSPESTLRMVDIMVILINGSLAIAHFGSLLANYWPIQRLNQQHSYSHR